MCFTDSIQKCSTFWFNLHLSPPQEPSFGLRNKHHYFKQMTAKGVETGVRGRNPEMLMLAELGRGRELDA